MGSSSALRGQATVNRRAQVSMAKAKAGFQEPQIHSSKIDLSLVIKTFGTPQGAVMTAPVLPVPAWEPAYVSIKTEQLIASRLPGCFSGIQDAMAAAAMAAAQAPAQVAAVAPPDESDDGSSEMQTEKKNSDGSHKSARRQRHSKLQIATSLRELQEEDPDCILVVRRIGKLGFNSLQYVREHFEQFGSVLKVLGSNRHERDPSDTAAVRLRPSGIAFVLMASPDDAAKALARGEEQLIVSQVAQVRQFHHRQHVQEETAETGACLAASSELRRIEQSPQSPKALPYVKMTI